MPPLTILIKPVSGRCDMRCQYCFYADELQYRQAEAAPVMPIDVLEGAVRRVLRSAEGSAHFLFQGGEPTLAGLPFFEAAVAAQRRYSAGRLQITNAIQTNGLHLSDEMISFFARAGESVTLAATVSAQNPTLNPDLLPAALRALAPEIAPDFAKFTRIETYDENMSLFR